MQPRPRTIIKDAAPALLLLLVGGATLNVAVAWGCAIAMPSTSRVFSDDEAMAVVEHHFQIDNAN